MLAASGGTVAATSLIVSRPAVADSGTEACRYSFSDIPQLSTRVVNRNNDNGDTLQFSIAGVGGTCPCGGGPTIEYAYFVSIPNLGQGGFGWTPSSTAQVTNPPVLWPNSGGSVTVGAGVRVTCAGSGGVPAVRCRYATATYNVGASRFAQTFTLDITSSNQPGGLPACSPAAVSATFRSIGALTMSPGWQPDPPDDRAEIQPQPTLEAEPVPDTSTPASTSTTTTPDAVSSTTPNTAVGTEPSTTTSPPTTTAPTTEPSTTTSTSTTTVPSTAAADPTTTTSPPSTALPPD